MGVFATGKIPCAGCCDPCKALPKTLSGTIADIASCGCTEVGDARFIISDVTLNGTFDFEKADGDDFWRSEIGTVTQTQYGPGDDCSGEVLSVTTFFVAGFIKCTTSKADGVSRLTIQLYGIEGDYPLTPSDSGLQVFFALVELTEEAIPNIFNCPADSGIAGGTIMVEAD